MPDTATQPSPPPEGPGLACAPGTMVGRYRIVSELGRGAMGVVYRATDTRLEREVALKVLSSVPGDHQELLERFQREVEIVSKLKHPGIVTIYEVGAARFSGPDGGPVSTPYFAMEYLAGGSVHQGIGPGRPLSPRTAARVVRDVARALHFAHEKGIVHRDLKPHNILIEPVESSSDTVQTHAALSLVDAFEAFPLQDGRRVLSFRVVLTDFGIARDRSSERALTAEGKLLGTPAYMSPEQARGSAGAVDARSDVYSLGAVFYELLTGVPPFDGDSLASLLWRVLHQDPAPPRRLLPGLHADFETVCLKAMEKRPDRRYPSAAAFADDLDRLLSGDLIHARRAGAWERAWRRARRNPVASVLAAGLLVVGAGGGALEWKDWRARQRADGERQELVRGYLAELERSGKAIVDAALARRAVGDIAGSQEYARSLEEPLERLIRRAPDLAEPWYHRGRMQRALGQEGEAEASQTRAVDLARRGGTPRGGSSLLRAALYERGVLRTQRYLRTFEERRGNLLATQVEGRTATDPVPPLPAVEEVESAYPELVQVRADAREDLVASVGMSAEGEPEWSALRGFLSIVEGADDAARPLLEAALQRDPCRQEAYTALGGLSERLGRWQEAGEWYEKGHAADLGYFPHVDGLVRCLIRRSLESGTTFIASAALLERARDVIEEILRLNPARSASWVLKAQACSSQAGRLASEGKDPDPVIELGRSACARAVEISGREAASFRWDAELCLRRALWRSEHGQVPTADLETAIAATTAALERDPRWGDAHYLQGQAWKLLGDWKARGGEPPHELYERAVRAYESAWALLPRDVRAPNNVALVMCMLAEWEERTGGDPIPTYRRAIEVYRRAVAAFPADMRPLGNLAISYLKIAAIERERNIDPTADLEIGIERLRSAIALAPGQAGLRSSLGMAYWELGIWKEAHGQDLSAELREARRNLADALSIDPSRATAAANMGIVLAAEARLKIRNGEDPTASYDLARQYLERSLANSRNNALNANNLGTVFFERGKWTSSLGKAPDADYATASEWFERALEWNPRYQRAARNLADLLRAMATAKAARGEDAGPELHLALERLEASGVAEGEDAESLLCTAHVLADLGRYLIEKGEEGRSDLERAQSLYEKALILRPGDRDTEERLGRVREAIRTQ